MQKKAAKKGCVIMATRLGETMYHFHIRPISRGKGHNLAARLSYIQNEKYYWNGYVKNQTKTRESVIHISSLPGFYSKEGTQKYINAVEKVEKRKTSRFGREIILAFIVEMKPQDNINMITIFLERLKEYRIFGVGAIHDLNTNNPHAHIVINERELLKNGELGRKLRENNKTEFLTSLRKIWADIINDTIKENGYENIIAPVSHLSFKERGLDYGSTLKIGNRRTQEDADSIKLENELILADNEVKKISREIKEQERVNRLNEEAKRKQKRVTIAERNRRQSTDKMKNLITKQKQAKEEEARRRQQQIEAEEQKKRKQLKEEAEWEQKLRGKRQENDSRKLEEEFNKHMREIIFGQGENHQKRKDKLKEKRTGAVEDISRIKALQNETPQKRKENSAYAPNKTSATTAPGISAVQRDIIKKQEEYFWQLYILPDITNNHDNSMASDYSHIRNPGTDR